MLVPESEGLYYFNPGPRFWYEDNPPWWHGSNHHVTGIVFLGGRLNCDKQFKEVKLHFKLERQWGFLGLCMRWDDFTLDVTDLVTKTEDKPNTVLLKAYNSYQVGKADAVTIYDCNKNKLKHFSSTHKEGHYGSWD